MSRILPRQRVIKRVFQAEEHGIWEAWTVDFETREENVLRNEVKTLLESLNLICRSWKPTEEF